MVSRKRITPILFFVGLLLSLSVGLAPAPSAYAAVAADFNPGRIIDDGIFFNGESMTVTQIQAFIAAKVPSCDTSGAQQSSHYNQSAGRFYTRAEWGALNGNPAPYVCLKDYRMDVPNRAPDTYCSGAITGGNKSAAQVITEVSRACQVNPQVMLVLLQKEQSLLTDDWPWSDQYTAATGFACPDTARCDSDFAGLFNQLYYGARQYQRYAKQSASFNYRAYTSPFVQYNPSSDCGGTNLYIHGQATAGLYNYTPYQPNQPALNNLYGTGDGCSAYGNRNFWRMFNDWFGSTKAFNANVNISQGLTTDAGTTAYEGQTVTASYEVSNTADYEILAGGLGICARLNGQYYDFGFIDQNPIAANGKKTISFSKVITNTGTLSMFICSYHASLGGWASTSFYPYSNSSSGARNSSVQIVGNPWIHAGVTLSPASPLAGQPVTATITIANASPTPVNIGTLVVAARDQSGNNVDFPGDPNITIAGSGTYTYSKTQTFVNPGHHSFFIAAFHQGVWRRDWPRTGASTVVRQGVFTVRDNPLIASNVTLSPASPAAGQPVTATMTIRNDAASPISIGLIAVAARDSRGNNVDFPGDPTVTIPANSTYTYSKTRSFSTPGEHSFFVANLRGSTWSTSYPKSTNTSIIRSAKLQVTDNPLITSGVSISPANPTTGQTVTATMTILNASADPVNIGLIVVAARDSNGNNVDFAGDNNVSIPAGSTYTYSKSRTFSTPGKHTFFVANLRNNTWDRNYPKSTDGSIIRQDNFTVAL